MSEYGARKEFIGMVEVDRPEFDLTRNPLERHTAKEQKSIEHPSKTNFRFTGSLELMKLKTSYVTYE